MDLQKITLATYIAGGVGVALLLFSFLFPYIFTDQGAWSPSDGQAYAAAAAELYRLTHEHGGHNHSHDGASTAHAEPAELAAARERFETEKQRLEGAVGGRHFSRSLFKWTGVLFILAAGGGAIFLRLRDLNG